MRIILLLCIFGIAARILAQDLEKPAPFRPVVMLHGFLASGDTWASFCDFFTRSGYPADYLYVHDWNTLNQGADHIQALDAAIDTLLMRTGARQIDLIGHSAGGGLAYRYLADSTRASKVCRYVHIGSRRQKQPAGPQGQIPTLNLWSKDDHITAAAGGTIEGAVNRMLSGLDHYQVATHFDAFSEVYHFLNNDMPHLHVQPTRAGVPIGGRAVFLGNNKPLSAARVELYYLDTSSGQRLSQLPDVQVRTDKDGRWYISHVQTGVPVELVLAAPETTRPVHYFFPGFERPCLLVYLRALPTGADFLSTVLNNLPCTSTQSVISIYLSSQSAQAGRDSLTINNISLSTHSIAPPEKVAISFFLYDEDGDGRSSIAPLNRFARFPFLTGVDMHLPPNEDIPLEIYFNGKLQRVRRIPSHEGIQVIVF
ncbi:MAG: hypothetical protein NZM43_09065 [Saprospiraceae bacterium]|nr:hypothetical protein [Saprospiraceae bacterium]MDW8484463.1 hypothetical protein [Saprospiraceae bacterium]